MGEPKIKVGATHQHDLVCHDANHIFDNILDCRIWAQNSYNFQMPNNYQDVQQPPSIAFEMNLHELTLQHTKYSQVLNYFGFLDSA